MILRDAVPRPRLEELALLGRDYEDEEALRAGLVQELLPEEDFEERCMERLEELAARDAATFAVTKRYLRSATVERIRAYDPQFQREFLDVWFRSSTQQRIAEIVEALRRD